MSNAINLSAGEGASNWNEAEAEEADPVTVHPDSITDAETVRQTWSLFLVDIPDMNGITWKMNSWQIHMVLHFKKISYLTTFLEYPAVEKFFVDKRLGPGPGDHGESTIPTACFNNNMAFTTPLGIANEVEKHQPEPSLLLDHGVHVPVQAAVDELYGILGPNVLHCVVKILAPQSAAFFAAFQLGRLGVSTDQYHDDFGGDIVWDAVFNKQDGPLAKLLQLLKQHPEGPFFLGQRPSYSDFIFVGFLRCMKSLAIAYYLKFWVFDKAIQDLLRGCGPWTVLTYQPF